MNDSNAISAAFSAAIGPSSGSPEQIFEIARKREVAASRLLMTFVVSGLLFMVFPGTFLGVWNLLQISGRESIASVSPAWLQAHGHAQVFGWVGSFILGIGLYSIPKMRGGLLSSLATGWACWALWTFAVSLRWASTVFLWQWKTLLPFSAVLELVAFLLFFRMVSRHQTAAPDKTRLELWIWVVISATAGFFLVLATNLAGCVYLAFHGAAPAFPHLLDQRYLALMTWGFLVPFVWGFSAKWMTIFLGLKPVRSRLLLSAVAINLGGLILIFADFPRSASWFFVASSATATVALRLFEPAERQAKTRGVHPSFPFFVRFAYAWLLVAAVLNVAAYRWDVSGGIWGASRHALTVGFISLMILSIGQRILPAFSGMRLLWSPKLMFVALALVAMGCTLRVTCEILAYQEYAAWAWSILPASAFFELAGLTAFAINILGTFILEPSHAHKQPSISAAPLKLS